MDRVLITGASGFIGSYLLQSAPNTVEIFESGRLPHSNKIDRNKLVADLTDYNIVKKYIVKNKIRTIIHTAGESNVDSVEKNVLSGVNSNLMSTINLVEIAKELDLFLIFLSSNAIFDGNSPPYEETSIPNPVNKYGVIKLACETIIRNKLENYCIVRPILTYGWNFNNTRINPVIFTIQNLRIGKKIKMVDDIYENPVYVHQVVEVIWKIVNLKYIGVINISGGSTVNRYELACEVANIFNLNRTLIESCSNSYFQNLAPRPKNTTFVNTKMASEFHVIPLTISKGLLMMKNELVK